MSKLITIFSPDGNAEKHTLPNARDLVNGAKYTWKKGVKVTPATWTPPHAVPSRDEKSKLLQKPASQEIFDRIGSHATEENNVRIDNNVLLNETSGPDEEEEEYVEDVVDDASEEDVVDETPVEEAAEEVVPEVSVELPRTPRGRRPRA